MIKKDNLLKILTYLFLSAGAILMILPFLWMVSTSFKDMSEVFVYPIKWIPDTFNLDNYKEVFNYMDFGRYYKNTIFVTIMRITGLFFTATMAGYGFGRLNFPGKKILFGCLLATMMIPTQTIMYPVFMTMKNFGWVDTYMALIIPQMLGAFGGMFSIFLLTQSFKAIPKELEEAAIIDGAGRFRIFWQIMLPQVKPAFAALLIFTFNSAWNDFLIPLIVTNSDKMKVLSLGIMGFTSLEEAVTPWNLMMAASLMTLLPIIIIFIVAQKHFIASAAGSGLKG